MPLKIDLGTFCIAVFLAWYMTIWWLLLIPIYAVVSPWRIVWTKRDGWSVTKEM